MIRQISIRFLLGLLLALSLAPRASAARWTFMVYLDGDNDLEASAIADFLEMAAVGSNDTVKIAVQFDRAAGYVTTYGDWSSCYRFLVDPGETPVVANAVQALGELNAGESGTLASFITWAAATYPADSYVLVMWNHGGGWRGGWPGKAPGQSRAICWDEDNGEDRLYLSEVREALQTANRRFDMICFDFCNGMMIEEAHELRAWCDYFVASEELEPADGYPYTPILAALKANPDTVPREFSKFIVNAYGASYNPGDQATQSSLEMSKLPAIVSALSTLANSMTTDYANIAARRAAATVFQSGDDPYSNGQYTEVDIGHFAGLLAASSPEPIASNAAAVKTAVQNAILANVSEDFDPNAFGLAIYMPSPTSTRNSYNPLYPYVTDYGRDTPWSSFCRRINSYRTYQGPFGIALTDPGDGLDTDGQYTLTWTDAVDANGVSVYKLDEFANAATLLEDGAENGTAKWTVNGFRLDTFVRRSGQYSFYSGNGNSVDYTLTLAAPLAPPAGKKVYMSYWTVFENENVYDFGYLEASANGAAWTKVDTFADFPESGHVRFHDLSAYAGGPLHLRFRLVNDGGFYFDGCYFDDIRVWTSDSMTTISSAIAETRYVVSGRADGSHLYRVSARDASGNWGEYTLPDSVNVRLLDLTSPTSFTLSLPPDGHETRAVTMILRWGTALDSTPPVRYRVRIDTEASISGALTVDTSWLVDTFYTVTLPANETYYWNVIARDSDGNQRFSTDTRRIVVDTAPPAGASLVDPLGGETTFSPVSLDWNAAVDTGSGFARYRLQIDTTGLFGGSLAVDSYQATPDTSLRLPRDTYAWRLILQDDAGNTVTVGPETFLVVVAPETEPPSAFTLLAPAAGLETNSTRFTLSWSTATDTTGPVSYRLILDTDMAGSYSLDTTLSGTSVIVDLPPNETYSWRVTASDALANARTVGDSTIVVDTAPPAVFALVGPRGGETRVAPVAFDWDASSDTGSGLARYRLQIDTTGTFAGALAADSYQAAPDTSLSLALETYSWRVIAYDDVGNARTVAADTFRVVETAAPGAFTLLAPASASETTNPLVTFSWSPASDSTPPVRYRLMADTDGAGDPALDTTVTATSIVARLAPNDTYQWRVTAIDALGYGRTVGDSQFAIDTAPPTAPVLSSPVRGDSVRLPVTLDWGAATDSIAGFSAYRLQIDTTGTFAGTLAVDTWMTTPDTDVTLALETYAWRVWAYDELGNSVSSAVETFVVSTPLPESSPPVLSSPVLTPSTSAPANTGFDTIHIGVGTRDSTGIGSATVDLGPLGGSESQPLHDDGTNGDTQAGDGLYAIGYIVPSTSLGGTFPLVIRVVDAWGNVESTIVRVTIQDVSAPVARILAPASLVTAETGPSSHFSMTVVPNSSLVRVVFETKSASGGGWTTAANDTAGPGFSLAWPLAGTAPGTYYVRAVGYTASGGDSSPDYATILVRSRGAAADTDYACLATESGYVHRRRITPYAADTIGVESGHLYVPRGAVTETSWFSVTFLTRLPDTLVFPSHLRFPPGCLAVLTGPSSFTRSLSYVVNYPDTDAQSDGVGATGIPEANLALYYWDESARAWMPVSGASVNGSSNRVSASLDHFTIFALAAPTTADSSLAGCVVFPNPFVPNDGRDANGKPYSAADPTSGILFDSLTVEVYIDVYDVAGRLVASMRKNSAFGRYQWDARANDGKELASGVYLAVIRSGAGEVVTRKVMIIR